MKRALVWLILAVFTTLCLCGSVFAAPAPMPPVLTGGSWSGQVRTSAGTKVSVKIVVTTQNFNRLTGSVTLGSRTLTANGYIDGAYVSMRGSDATHYIQIYGDLGWYPGARIIAYSIYDETAVEYFDSILTPGP